MDLDTIIDRALAQGIELARNSRHEGAVHLACQLRDNRVSQTDAEATMRMYAGVVPDKAGDPFTESEAVRTYRSVLSRGPRDPWRGADPTTARIRQTAAETHRIEHCDRSEGTEAGEVHPEWAEALRAVSMPKDVERAHFKLCRTEQARCVTEAALEPEALSPADMERGARLMDALPVAFDRVALFAVARGEGIRESTALRLRRHFLSTGTVRPCPLGWVRKTALSPAS